jgi:RimJ/RimL family protein N-acetyltransferase
MLGRGLAGRWEIAFEVEPEARGRGLGTALASAGPWLAPGDPVFAQVSPGNVASLRVLLAAGYRPIGSEVLLLHGNDHVY